MNTHLRYVVLFVLASLASLPACDVEPTDRSAQAPAEKSGSGSTAASPAPDLRPDAQTPDAQAPDPGGAPQADRAQMVDAAPQIEGNVWVLESIGDPEDPQPALEGVEVTARFNASKVTGNAGCNSYSASFKIDGENLKIGQPIATRKFCGAAGVMEQEAAFLSALAKAAAYRVEDGRLKITYETKQTLNFHEQAESTSPQK
jgi:heat shock protein HslJ